MGNRCVAGLSTSTTPCFGSRARARPNLFIYKNQIRSISEAGTGATHAQGRKRGTSPARSLPTKRALEPPRETQMLNWKPRKSAAIAREAGARLREFFAQGVETEYKGDVDLVTVADRSVEKSSRPARRGLPRPRSLRRRGNSASAWKGSSAGTSIRSIGNHQLRPRLSAVLRFAWPRAPSPRHKAR